MGCLCVVLKHAGSDFQGLGITWSAENIGPVVSGSLLSLHFPAADSKAIKF